MYVSRQSLNEYKNAAEVLEATKKPAAPQQVLADKPKHLLAIHSAPRETWQPLVDRMLAKEADSKDLGHERTLAKTAEIYYGASKNLSQIGVWSRRFSWVERAQSWDDWHEMIRRDAVEDHLRAQAKDHGRREAALLERALGVREAAMDQAEKRSAGDGGPTTAIRARSIGRNPRRIGIAARA